MNISLAGRTALVTGSSRGIGAAIARKLAQAGCRVVVHANRGRREADQVAAEIANAGGQAAVVQGDFFLGGWRPRRSARSICQIRSAGHPGE